MKKAALYIRVSTEKQVQEGYSISAQKENLIKFAKNQGWNIFDIYSDEGVSGKNIKDRAEIKRLINDIKSKNIDVVVLYKFDRLTRDISDTEDIIKLIQEFGIEVYTISGGIVDVSTATGRFYIRMSGVVAQLEREQTIERVKFALIQKVKEGKSLCSSTPSYGYNRVKHQEIQTINEEEAKVVKRIFKMYISGKNFTEIANILNAEGIPTKKKGKIQKRRNSNASYVINSVWQAKTIRLILSNITYIGGVRYGINSSNGFEVFNGLHEPIISKELWGKAQKRLRRIKKIFRTNHPKEDVYYCGVLICGICKNKLTTQRTVKRKKDGTRKVYCGYRCINREKGKCIALAMSHKKVEKAFLNYIENIELFEFKSIDIKPDEEELINIKKLNKRILEINNKKKEVMNLFVRNNISHDEMKYMISELNKQYKILNNELKLLEKSYRYKEIDKNLISNKLKLHWEYLSNKERLEFLTEFIKQIVVINKNSLIEIKEINFY